MKNALQELYSVVHSSKKMEMKDSAVLPSSWIWHELLCPESIHRENCCICTCFEQGWAINKWLCYVSGTWRLTWMLYPSKVASSKPWVSSEKVLRLSSKTIEKCKWDNWGVSRHRLEWTIPSFFQNEKLRFSVRPPFYIIVMTKIVYHNWNRFPNQP